MWLHSFPIQKSLFPYLLSMAWPCGLLVSLQRKGQRASSKSGPQEALHASLSQILVTTMWTIPDEPAGEWETSWTRSQLSHLRWPWTHSWLEMHNEPGQEEDDPTDPRAMNLTLLSHRVWRNLLRNYIKMVRKAKFLSFVLYSGESEWDNNSCIGKNHLLLKDFGR